MNYRNLRSPLIFACLGAISVGCSGGGTPSGELRRFAADDTVGVVDQNLVTADPNVSSDGRGSLKIVATAPETVRLYRVANIDVEDARLIYRVDVRTQDVDGAVYPEMLCQFAGKGEYFSRGLQNQLTGTSDWTMLQTPFFLKKGEDPDTVRLNIVITGPGTVWVDNLRLDKAPL